MTLKQQVVGINNFLTRIYGKETRLSTLLADFGISDQQIQLLRARHQKQVVRSFLAALKKQITTRDQRLLSHRMSAKWRKKPARQRKTSVSSSNGFGLQGTDWDPPVIRHDPRKFTEGLTMCPHGVLKTRICAICDPEGFRKEMGDF